MFLICRPRIWNCLAFMLHEIYCLAHKYSSTSKHSSQIATLFSVGTPVYMAAVNMILAMSLQIQLLFFYPMTMLVFSAQSNWKYESMSWKEHNSYELESQTHTCLMTSFLTHCAYHHHVVCCIQWFIQFSFARKCNFCFYTN